MFDAFLECDVIFCDLLLSEDNIETHLNWFQHRVETMRELQTKSQQLRDRKGTIVNEDHDEDEETSHSLSATNRSCFIASAKITRSNQKS